MVIHTICPRHFFRGGNVFPEGRSPMLNCGPGHQTITYAEMTLQARLVCGYVWRKTSGSFSFGYIEIFSRIILLRSLMLGKVLDKWYFNNRKGTQQHAAADKGRLKGYILHPSAANINCSLNHFVNYVNFDQTFFATVRGYQWRFG